VRHDFLAHQGAKLLVGEILSRGGDDLARGVNIAKAMARIQGRQQLARRQVAGAAEQHQVETLPCH